MDALTPAERRGVLVVACLLALGAGHDLWRASRPLPAPVAAPMDRANDAVVPPEGGGAEAAAPAPAPAPLDLNRATAAELDALPGIGPVLAARIVAHREAHGPFRSPEELLAVRGIGPHSLSRIAARLTTRSASVPRRDSLDRLRVLGSGRSRSSAP